MTSSQITITQPDDWHLHLRDGDALNSVALFTARQFARAIIMPNLNPPITTVVQAVEYLDQILAAVDGTDFEPLMTLYLTDNTSPDEIIAARKSCFIKALKLYPAGATTNSDAGVTDIRLCDDALEEMQKAGLPLLIHGEVTDPLVDIFDREKVFIETTLQPLTQRFPELKIVFEHITTKEAADFVLQSGDHIAATITPHHLLLNRNAILAGGIHPAQCIVGRCLNVRRIAKHWSPQPPASMPNFFSVPTAPHIPKARKNPPAAAPAFTVPTPH